MSHHFDTCQTPGDYFLQYFDSAMRQNIVYQTNLYSNQKRKNFTPLTERELLGFVGINFVMGYHKLPSWTDYWKLDRDLAVPLVAETMPRNRFAKVLSNLHINDNSSIPPGNKDKLFKIRPLITSMNENYAKLYNVSPKVSIDESMILFKGRSTLKQYNPKKPIKRGYKLWMRADMDGYISKFDIYQGKSVTQDVEGVPNKFGLGERVIYNLTADLKNKNHQVFCDNYFSSVPLMEYLKDNGIMACGTIRSDRKGLPKGMKADKDLGRGEHDFRISDTGIGYYKWMDNKAVHMVSNFHGSEVSFVYRTQKDGSKKEFSCPTVVKNYNQDMGGVDKADMLCSIHGLGRKSKKWWHRIFFGILDRTLVNASISYMKLERKSISILDFRRSVAQELLTIARIPKVGRPSSTPKPLKNRKRRSTEYSVERGCRLQNRGAHWVVYDKKQRGRCEVCSKKKIESRPHSQCSVCMVFLCCNENKNCFLEYHEVEE